MLNAISSMPVTKTGLLTCPYQVIMKAKGLFKQLVDNYDGKDDSYVDLVQGVFKCCGADSSLDYRRQGPPESCAIETYTRGCNKVVPDVLDNYSALAAGVALGAGALMVSVLNSPGAL